MSNLKKRQLILIPIIVVLVLAQNVAMRHTLDSRMTHQSFLFHIWDNISFYSPSCYAKDFTNILNYVLFFALSASAAFLRASALLASISSTVFSFIRTPV